MPSIQQQFRQLMGPNFQVSPRFIARLPRLAKPVSIETLHDAKVFIRRWMIRDKDRTLKRLHTQLISVRRNEDVSAAIDALKSALEARGLLPLGRGLN